MDDKKFIKAALERDFAKYPVYFSFETRQAYTLEKGRVVKMKTKLSNETTVASGEKIPNYGKMKQIGLIGNAYRKALKK